MYCIQCILACQKALLHTVGYPESCLGCFTHCQWLEQKGTNLWSVELFSSMDRFLTTTLDQWHTRVECKTLHSLISALSYWLSSNNHLNLIYITLSFQGCHELYVRYILNQRLYKPRPQAKWTELRVIYCTVWDYIRMQFGYVGMVKQPCTGTSAHSWSVTHQEGHVSSRQAVANEPSVTTISGQQLCICSCSRLIGWGNNSNIFEC